MSGLQLQREESKRKQRQWTKCQNNAERQFVNLHTRFTAVYTHIYTIYTARRRVEAAAAAKKHQKQRTFSLSLSLAHEALVRQVVSISSVAYANQRLYYIYAEVNKPSV